MNEETFEKAIGLRRKIRRKKDEIDTWNACTEYKNDGSIVLSKNGLKESCVKISEFISFDEIKKMALDRFNAELNALTKEFERL